MVLVRFAPSPTGYLHQGNIRTALFNYLFARQNNGEVVLRIDDTDPERSKPEFEAAIGKDLEWLGLTTQEGPQGGGNYGPYRQSERQEIYQKYLKQLIESKKVYACFATPEEIEAQRRGALATGKTFCFRSAHRDLSPEEHQAKLDSGLKPHYRFAVDREIIKFEDVVYGEKVFDTATIGDFTVARADGTPVYLLASAIDDCLMKISHVIRGEDGMSNTPRQILLQRALGWEPPQFAHLPLILGPDHSLLSKRNGSASVGELQEKGYLPEAILNYLALLGWSPPEGKEILSLDELVQHFRLDKVSRSSSIFDWAKLNYINSVYLRRLSQEDYLALAQKSLQQSPPKIDGATEEQIQYSLISLRPNIQTLGEIPGWVELILGENPITTDAAKEVLGAKESLKVWKSSLGLLKELGEELNESIYKEFMEALKKESKIKGKKLFMPFRVALTGSTEGPELVNLFKCLGKTKVMERIERVLKDLQHEESK